MPSTTSKRAVRAALENVRFPADKDRLVDAAQAALDRGEPAVDSATVAALGAVQPVDYGSIADVLASVPLDEPSGRDDAPRHHRHDGLAQHEKDLPPVNPIVEELGENRGS